MIRVTIELLPGGTEERKRILGRLEVSNDGTGDQFNGNYKGRLYSEYCQGREGQVLGFKRKNQSVWSLVGAFLKLYGHTRHSPKLMSKTG